jgi:hypothetical protein
VKQDELQQVLTTFAADRVALLERHEAGARIVSQYDFNNAYQYIISREETHLQWLQTALAEFSAALPPPSSPLVVPELARSRKAPVDGAFRAILNDDATQLGAFVERWTGRIEVMTHARHRLMLNVVLGESREHQQLFEQAAAGIQDLLGKRTGGVARQGNVLPVRWME